MISSMQQQQGKCPQYKLGKPLPEGPTNLYKVPAHLDD